MKNVLLISNKVFHYRLKVYDYLFFKFKDKGYELSLLTNEIQNISTNNPELKIYIEPFSILKYLRKIKLLDPDYVIIFLHLKNLIMLPIIIYLKLNNIPVIYWNHGINQKDPNNIFKNLIYYVIHNLVDGILLYSPIEKIHIKTKNHKKTFIANNTIVFDEELYPVKENKNVLKNEFGIRSRFNILFVGRDTKIKKLDLIIETVKSLKNEDIGLLIVSPLRNINKTLESIKGYDQIRYLGEIYDKTALSKIYWISDIFCIPGANGLGLNEAMFWGLPCLTLKALHGPEIWYLKNGENGYILNNSTELKEKILMLYEDRILLSRMSKKSREIILSQGHVNDMYKGFEAVIKVCKD